jgi:hypothetical protein
MMASRRVEWRYRNSTFWREFLCWLFGHQWVRGEEFGGGRGEQFWCGRCHDRKIIWE